MEKFAINCLNWFAALPTVAIITLAGMIILTISIFVSLKKDKL